MIQEYATERGGHRIHVHNRIVALRLDGIVGLQKAIESHHGSTRWIVPKLVPAFHRKAGSDAQRVLLVDILKLCLNDSCKKGAKSG